MRFISRPAWGRVPFDTKHREPWLRQPFSPDEYQDRWSRVAEQLRERDLDALVVMGKPGDCGDVRYLTNFDSYVGSTYVVVTRDGECAVATNSLMRAEPMQSSIWMTHVDDVRVTSPRRYSPNARPLESLVCDILAEHGLKDGRIAKAGAVDSSAFESGAFGPKMQAFVDFSAELVEVSAIKSPAELAVLRQANAIASEVFVAVSAAAKIGVTEATLAGVAFGTMMSHGAEGSAFSLALVAGERSGLKHALPTDYEIRDGDFLFMDFGLIFEGYMTDNARTGVIGTATDDKLEFVHTAEAMTEAALAVAGPGVPQHVLDDAAFKVATDNGFHGDYYFRAHGVGTTLFQRPRFHPGSEIALRPNEVFSLEPMLVRHGYGSACVERTVLVTETGVEILDTDPGLWLRT